MEAGRKNQVLKLKQFSEEEKTQQYSCGAQPVIWEDGGQYLYSVLNRVV
jgi:hypothetical protein